MATEYRICPYCQNKSASARKNCARLGIACKGTGYVDANGESVGIKPGAKKR